MSKTDQSAIKASDVPKLVDGADPVAAGLSPADFFLMSRIDGHSDVHTIGMLMAQSDAAVTETLARLVSVGMVQIPGRGGAQDARAAGAPRAEAQRAPSTHGAGRPAPVASRPTPTQRPASRNDLRSGGFDRVPTGNRRPAVSEARPRPEPEVRQPVSNPTQRPIGAAARAAKTEAERSTVLSLALAPGNWPVPFEQFTFDPNEMSTGSALTDEQKQVVLYFHYHLRRVSYYDLFAIAKTADRRDVKGAYFALSKAFHPDRWFRKDVGQFGDRIEDVFKWLNRAYGVLGNPRKRKGYDRLLQRGYVGEWQLEGQRDGNVAVPPPAQPRASAGPATEGARSTGIIEVRARQAAAGGDWAAAADLYQRAMQVSPSSELRIRVVECMIKANLDPTQIEKEIAGAAAAERDDVRMLALEAEVARRLDERDRARRCFERILAKEPGNPVARLGLDRLRDVSSE